MMHKQWTIAIAAMLGMVLPLASADAQFGARLRERLAQRQSAPPAAGAQDLAYGGDPLQHLDFWKSTTATGPAPLVIFVHGGGWKRGDKDNATGATKVEHYRAAGYAVVSIDYRLVPAHTVEDQAADVAHATAFLLGQAAKLGVDAHRVVLMGHSAGAHLAALVGTDPHYLAAAGLAPDAFAGIVLLDGAAYDVPRQIADGNRLMHDTYVQAFGTDPARQRTLSPTVQAAQPNSPSFLILHIDRSDGTEQSNALAVALSGAGTAVELHALDGKGLRGHAEINRDMGDPNYPGTPLVDAYLAKVFRR